MRSVAKLSVVSQLRALFQPLQKAPGPGINMAKQLVARDFSLLTLDW